MVEPVSIESVGSLEAWASEKTSKDILVQLKSMGVKIVTQGKALEKQMSAGLQSALDMASDLKGGAKAATDATKSAFKAQEKKIKEEKDFYSGLIDSMKDVPGLGPIVRIFDKVTNSFMKSMISATAVLAGMTGAKFISQMDSARKFYERGITLQSDQATGIAAAADAAQNMRMTISELAKLTEEYGGTLRMFDIVKVSIAAKDMSKHLEQFGVTTLETTELLADYLETQRFLGFTERVDNLQSAKFRKLAMEDTIEWSAVLGKTRKEIQETSSNLLKDTFIASWFRNSKDASDGVKRFASVVAKALGTIEGGAEATGDIMKMVASSVPAANKTYIDLMENGLAEAAGVFMDLRRTIRNKGDPVPGLRRLAEALSKENLSVAYLRQSTDESAESVIRMSTALGIFENQLRVDPGAYEMSQEQAKNAAIMNNTWRDAKIILSQGVARAFGDPKTVEFLKEALEEFATVLKDNKDTIISFITSFTTAMLGFTQIVLTATKYLSYLWLGVDTVTTALSTFFGGLLHMNEATSKVIGHAAGIVITLVALKAALLVLAITAGKVTAAFKARTVAGGGGGILSSLFGGGGDGGSKKKFDRPSRFNLSSLKKGGGLMAGLAGGGMSILAMGKFLLIGAVIAAIVTIAAIVYKKFTATDSADSQTVVAHRVVMVQTNSIISSNTGLMVGLLEEIRDANVNKSGSIVSHDEQENNFIHKDFLAMINTLERNGRTMQDQLVILKQNQDKLVSIARSTGKFSTNDAT